jgi:hypothetical protein
MARPLLFSRAFAADGGKETTMKKRWMTAAAAALLIGLPALASEGGMEAAHDALTEGAPDAGEIALPDEADDQNNDGHHENVQESKDEHEDETDLHEADHDMDHAGEAGEVDGSTSSEGNH